MKKIKKKLLPKLLISRTLAFNISATESPIELRIGNQNKIWLHHYVLKSVDLADWCPKIIYVNS